MKHNSTHTVSFSQAKHSSSCCIYCQNQDPLSYKFMNTKKKLTGYIGKPAHIFSRLHQLTDGLFNGKHTSDIFFRICYAGTRNFNNTNGNTILQTSTFIVDVLIYVSAIPLKCFRYAKKNRTHSNILTYWKNTFSNLTGENCEDYHILLARTLSSYHCIQDYVKKTYKSSPTVLFL